MKHPAEASALLEKHNLAPDALEKSGLVELKSLSQQLRGTEEQKKALEERIRAVERFPVALSTFEQRPSQLSSETTETALRATSLMKLYEPGRMGPLESALKAGSFFAEALRKARVKPEKP
jgi:hypothetical protein